MCTTLLELYDTTLRVLIMIPLIKVSPLLEVSYFTRVVYPQYMEQLIVCYFSSFSVNPHSLMFY